MHIDSQLIEKLKRNALDIGLDVFYIICMLIFMFECFHLNMISY